MIGDTEVPAPSAELKGKVVDEVVKGYYLNDKIIRHAKVVVGNNARMREFENLKMILPDQYIFKFSNHQIFKFQECQKEIITKYWE